jgi:hypothetical protein
MWGEYNDVDVVVFVDVEVDVDVIVEIIQAAHIMPAR